MKLEKISINNNLSNFIIVIPVIYHEIYKIFTTILIETNVIYFHPSIFKTNKIYFIFWIFKTYKFFLCHNFIAYILAFF